MAGADGSALESSLWWSGLSFNEAVHEVASAVPLGRVTTYGAIAAALGRPRAARMVGWAMHQAHGPDIPCHRVVNRIGAMSAPWVFGGPDVQRIMLEAEGITFDSEGLIDMARHFWRPAPADRPAPAERPGGLAIRDAQPF